MLIEQTVALIIEMKSQYTSDDRQGKKIVEDSKYAAEQVQLLIISFGYNGLNTFFAT